jgi:tetratricopeptide (TPR) repeat protein
MHPGIAIVDRSRTLAAYEPFQQLDYCPVVVARLRRALGEITDAEVAKALAPATSALPGDDPGGVAKRHLSFGRKLLAAKAYALAHDNARKAAAIAPSAAAWTLEGEIFAAEGKCADAAKAFDAALTLAPGDPAATNGKQGCKR